MIDKNTPHNERKKRLKKAYAQSNIIKGFIVIGFVFFLFAGGEKDFKVNILLILLGTLLVYVGYKKYKAIKNNESIEEESRDH